MTAELTRRVLTLLFVREGDRLLLGYKKNGFGKGKWNGFGGKVKDGETVEAAAIRELEEESGVIVSYTSLKKLAKMEMEFEGWNELLEIHLFTTHTFCEMRPKWFHITDLPFSEMWADDSHWFPFLLAEKKFIAKFQFRDMETISSFFIKLVDDLNAPS
ncbi:unnamed protein product [Darwinula stevensoni]|uniref:Oxidized purine nucleoside triphosphate hydrolase n=1 Tax=Darwinula stevensoni TaxID=69355 RepID=A0A7R8XMS5_9CRUS|nr:unnamed protein product [Darwinula stevensoni]CAG0895916.1 unnamed protein product [Darwinula stevensoni]